MQAYQTLKRELEVPDSLMCILTRLISHENGQILVLMTRKFLTAFEVTEKLKGKNLKEITSILRTLYQEGFLDKKPIGGEEAYRCRSFYDIIGSHLQESRYEALGFANLHTLRHYYLSTRIEKTEKAIKSGQLRYSSKVIPLEKSIPATQYILPTQQAIEFLKEARLFALTTCGCRVAFRNCKNPVNTCLLLDEEAEYLISRKYAKRISLEKARSVLGIANRAGLIHLALYLPGQKVYAICSCCPCCCHDLQALLKCGKTFFVAKSDFVARCNPELCNGCGTCIKRCIFGAREMRNGKSLVKANCYGCGLCVTTCCTKATELFPKKRNRNQN